MIGTERRQERSRDRVLDIGELKAIWDATAGDEDYNAIVRLLLLTGQRITEIGSLRWSEIEGDRIVLPPARTKNNRAHVVPLSPVARAILDARPRRGDFVFGRLAQSAVCRMVTRQGGARRPVTQALSAVGASRPPPQGRDAHGRAWELSRM